MHIKLEVRSFTRSWDNRGYFKKLGQSLDTPTLPFLQIFNGLLFRWTLWMLRPNLRSKFEVRSFTHSRNNRGHLKTLGSPWIRPCSLSFLITFIVIISLIILFYLFTTWVHECMMLRKTRLCHSGVMSSWAQKAALCLKRCKIGPTDGIIGSRIHAFDWYQNQWPWIMTLSGRNVTLAEIKKTYGTHWTNFYQDGPILSAAKCRPMVLVSKKLWMVSCFAVVVYRLQSRMKRVEHSIIRT